MTLVSSSRRMKSTCSPPAARPYARRACQRARLKHPGRGLGTRSCPVALPHRQAPRSSHRQQARTLAGYVRRGVAPVELKLTAAVGRDHDGVGVLHGEGRILLGHHPLHHDFITTFIRVLARIQLHPVDVSPAHLGRHAGVARQSRAFRNGGLELSAGPPPQFLSSYTGIGRHFACKFLLGDF